MLLPFGNSNLRPLGAPQIYNGAKWIALSSEEGRKVLDEVNAKEE